MPRRPKTQRCAWILTDGSRCGSFVNVAEPSGLCVTHRGANNNQAYRFKKKDRKVITDPIEIVRELAASRDDGIRLRAADLLLAYAKDEAARKATLGEDDYRDWLPLLSQAEVHLLKFSVAITRRIKTLGRQRLRDEAPPTGWSHRFFGAVERLAESWTMPAFDESDLTLEELQAEVAQRENDARVAERLADREARSTAPPPQKSSAPVSDGQEDDADEPVTLASLNEDYKRNPPEDDPSW
ncbi:MAG TPA: hypothetical protein VJN96_04230 [Vicinamibacterales bacterium]|nr:hypothetical protein [Vicinamibacterales bacterium]